MAIVRNALAIILGYAIFVVSAVLLFQLSGIDAHQEPSITFMVGAIVYGMLSSLTGGFIAQVISKSKTLMVNYVLGFIIASFAAFSMFKTSGSHYSQIAAIFLFAPASILGGLIYLRKAKKT